MYTLLFGCYMNRRLNDTLRRRIKSIATAAMDSGLASLWYDKAIPSLERCVVEQESEELKLKDLASVFYLYAAFCVASVLVFAAELLVNRCTHLGNRERLHRRPRRLIRPGPRNVFVRHQAMAVF